MFNGICGVISRTACCREPLTFSKAFASGRWWPQPSLSRNDGSVSVLSNGSDTDSEIVKHSRFIGSVIEGGNVNTNQKSDIVDSKKSKDSVELRRERAAPVYAKPRRTGKKVYSLIPWKNGELIADYVLFEDSIDKCKVPWKDYSTLTSSERNIYMAHLKAVKDHKLSYRDPETGWKVMTVSRLLFNGKCCGSGCRHCPYGHVNAPPEIKKDRVWNGAFYV